MTSNRNTLLLLAAGQSKRFTSDKLLSELFGVPLLEHSAKLYRHRYNVERYAVVANTQNERIHLLKETNWQIILNSAPENGMSHSIKLGIEHAKKVNSPILLIALADMPLVREDHLDQLCNLIDNGAKVAISKSNSKLSPPVALHRDTWHQLQHLSGDSGAKQIIEGMEGVRTLETDNQVLQDVDTIEDLERLRVLYD